MTRNWTSDLGTWRTTEDGRMRFTPHQEAPALPSNGPVAEPAASMLPTDAKAEEPKPVACGECAFDLFPTCPETCPSNRMESARQLLAELGFDQMVDVATVTRERDKAREQLENQRRARESAVAEHNKTHTSVGRLLTDLAMVRMERDSLRQQLDSTVAQLEDEEKKALRKQLADTLAQLDIEKLERRQERDAAREAYAGIRECANEQVEHLAAAEKERDEALALCKQAVERAEQLERERDRLDKEKLEREHQLNLAVEFSRERGDLLAEAQRELAREIAEHDRQLDEQREEFHARHTALKREVNDAHDAIWAGRLNILNGLAALKKAVAE